jgi:Tol biopolymer transport system component
VAGGGNTELDLDVMTATAGQRRPSRVERLHIELGLESGFPNPDPPLAGAGSLLAYDAVQDPVVGGGSRERAVRRVVGRAARTVFAFDDPLALAVDGRRLAVVRQELGGDGCGCSAAATWSPDGRRIAFLQGNADINSVMPAEVALINADGSGRATITHDGLTRLDIGADLSSLDWSPDGTEIAYSYFKVGQRTIAVVRPDGTGTHDLVSGEDPAWSPDGSAIAFSRSEDPTPHGIFVANADGTSVRQLASGGEGPAWSPDGKQIAYTSGGALFVVNVDGSGLRQIATAPASAQDPDWSPDGRQIVFGSLLTLGGRGGLWVVNADGTGLRQLSSEDDAYPRWSPDGRRILFTSARDDIVNNSEGLRLELYTMNSDGTDTRPLTFTRPAEWASVGEIHGRSGERLASFEALGAPAQTIILGSVTESRSVGLGGNRLAVLSVLARSHEARITLFDAHSGAPQHVVPVPGGSPFELAGVSGRWVVFRTGKTIRALDASTLRTAILAVARDGPIGLSVSGRRVAWAENACSCTGGRIRALTLPR